MAGKAKSVHLTVSDLKTHKTIFTKTFFNSAECNTYVKSEEFLEKYPKEQFYVVKETY